MDMSREDLESMFVNEGSQMYTGGLEDLNTDAEEIEVNYSDGDGDSDNAYCSDVNYGVRDDGNGDDGDGDGDADGDGDDLEGGGRLYCFENGIMINGMVDILNIDMKNITTEEVGRLDFGDLNMAYQFYRWYGRMVGFSVRKSRIVRNKKGEKIQQTFLCSREGYREERGLTMENRSRVPKHETRCGCEAKFRVHVDKESGRWYVTLFSFDHNHELLEGNFCALLPAHRKMTTTDILLIENYRKVGIRPTQMYGALANNAGGYDKVGFVRKDIYNQVDKLKRQEWSDASGALKYLQELSLNDPLMFVRHTVDDERRLEHLFLCDGESQMNYQVFGDVLAFDATYKKNKYLCPLVVFSGVNHHNQTIVFASAIVSNETEETYVWLLEQLMQVMKGKAPSSVITDGDVAMRNSIRRVFPHAHHRLCAWHLIRNAINNVKIPDFMPCFKECMLGDFEVAQFEHKWGEMVAKFGLEDNNWITEMYEKRKMWATSHIRGNFFAGIRTTSRCEALHSHVGKFVHSKITLSDFVQQFHRCLTYFRFREVEADFHSEYGQAVLQTSLHSLERSASRYFTKEIFFLFRPVLTKASLITVMECQETSMSSIYLVSKYRRHGNTWHVSYCPSLVEFRCSCLRMESIGLPCDHIVVVLVFLDFSELPKSLVLDRWSKGAKDVIHGTYPDGSLYWDSHLIARYATLFHLSREVSELAYRDDEDYNEFVDFLTSELSRLKLKYSSAQAENVIESQTMNEMIQDPPQVRTKGCGSSANTAAGTSRRVQTCRLCGASGHNRRSCNTIRRVAGTSGVSTALGGIPAEQWDEDINTWMGNEQADTFIP